MLEKFSKQKNNDNFLDWRRERVEEVRSLG